MERESTCKSTLTPLILSDDASPVLRGRRTPHSSERAEEMVALAHALPRAGRAGTLNVPAPQNPTECVPYLITWSGGTPPYTLSIVSPRAPPDSVFPNLDVTSFTWAANIPASFSVAFKVVEATGSSVTTSAVTMHKGDDESCLDSSAGSASQPSDPSTSSSAPPPSPSPSPSPTSPSTTTTSTTSTDSPSPTSQSPDPPSPTSEPDQSSSAASANTTGAGSVETSLASGSLSATSTNPNPPSGTTTDSGGPSGSGPTSGSSATSGVGNIPSLSYSSSGSSTIEPTANTSATVTPSPGSGPANHSLSIGAIVSIVIAVIALILVLAMILLRRHRRRLARAALRPDAYTPLQSIATSTSHDRHSLTSKLHQDSDHGDLKGSRFSVATVASSIPALTTISSVGAEPATLVIDRAQPTIVEELSHSAAAPSTSPPKTSLDEPLSVIREVPGAPPELLPSSPPSGTLDSDSKPPEPSPSPPPARVVQRERPRRLRERPPVFEEDGGIRLAGGPLDEPPQEFLPPPYRRY
ncbi:hypothetical protein VTO73DRAFT_12208 [Trametes versicolor]